MFRKLLFSLFILPSAFLLPLSNSDEVASDVQEDVRCPPYLLGNETIPCHLLNETCYCFSTLKAPNWPLATARCREGNMSLISIETEAEDEMIREHVLNTINPIAGVNGTEYWTSGRYSTLNQRWEWTSTGEAINYTNWFPNQPDFDNGDSCLLLYYLTDSRGLWADNSWVHGVPFICEG